MDALEEVVYGIKIGGMVFVSVVIVASTLMLMIKESEKPNKIDK